MYQVVSLVQPGLHYAVEMDMCGTGMDVVPVGQKRNKVEGRREKVGERSERRRES